MAVSPATISNINHQLFQKYGVTCTFTDMVCSFVEPIDGRYFTLKL